MSETSTSTAQQTLAAALAESQAALRRRALMDSVLRGLPAMLWLLALGGCLALIAVYWVTSTAWQNRLLVVSLLLGIVGVLWMVICVTRAQRRAMPSAQSAAERLDAAQDTHNRIATAWSFSDVADASPFMQAAVAQGVSALQQADARQPALPPLRVQLLKIATAPMLVLCVLGLVTVIDATVIHPSGTLTPIPTDIPDHQSASMAGDTPTTTNPQQTPESNTSRSENALLATAQSASASQATASPQANQPSESGLSGGAGATSSSGSATPAGGSQRAAASGSEAAASASSAQANAASDAAQEGAANASKASIPSATAGSNAGRATGGDVDSRDQPAGDDQLAEGEEPEPVEEASQNQQRGGMRASLLDRRAAASRELGITGPNSGRPGTGRGGPSPAKKSRGTASIIMGVPIPDFLPGQRRPGPFISTNTRVPPTPAETEPSTAVLPNAVQSKETPVSPFIVPYDDAQAVTNYLVQWHAMNAGQANSQNALPTDGDDGESTQPVSR